MMSDAIPTIAEAARLIAAKQPVAGRTDPGLPRPGAPARQPAARLYPLDRGARDGRGPRRRARDHGRRAEAAARHPDRPQGHRRHQGHPDDLPVEASADNVPDADAACAERLAAAGTVLMGKTTTHEFADGGPSFDVPWPPARNPWDTDHFTAGSSSGTGAGVAAGLILGGIGTDTGGSIRGPAALCGIAGIKPTYGLVSRAGVAPAAFSLDHIGPMAWTAEDCALMLQALGRPRPARPGERQAAGARLQRADRQRGQGPQDRRDPPFPRDRLPGQPRYPARHRRRDRMPARPRRRDPRGAVVAVAGLGGCGSLISIVERAAAYEEWTRTRLGDFGERVRSRLMLGAFVSGVDYLQAVRRRRELRAQLQHAMAGLDVVLTAAQPSEAPRSTPCRNGICSRRRALRCRSTLPGIRRLDLLGVWRGRIAGRDPARRQAVPGADPFPRRRRLRKGDRFPQQTPGAGLRPCHGLSGMPLCGS